MLLVTVPKRPVPAVLGLVAAAAVVPKNEVGFEVSVVTVPNAELPPKIDIVSEFGVEKELPPNMLLEETVETAGTAGEHMLNDPSRLDVASVVDVGEIAEVIKGDVEAGIGDGVTTEPNEKPEGVVVVVGLVTADVTAVVIDAVGAAEETETDVVTVPKIGIDSTVVVSDLADKFIALVAIPKLNPPLPPNASSELEVLVEGGLTDPNRVESVEVLTAAVEELPSVATTTDESTIVAVVESGPADITAHPLEEVVVVAGALMETKIPVPGAMVTVDVPNILEAVLAFTDDPFGGLCVSTFWSKFVRVGNAVLALSSTTPVFPKLGAEGSSFLSSCLGFSSIFTSGSFSLVKFKTGAVGCAVPNVVVNGVEAPNANAALLLALNVSNLLDSRFVLPELSVFGIAWMVVLPKSNTIGFVVGSWFSLSLVEVS